MAQLRERVSFYELPLIANGSGGSTSGEPVLKFSTFADVKQKRGVRGDENARLIITKYYSVVIRYAESHIPKINMIMKYKGERFQVLEISDCDERKLMQELIVVKS